MNESHQREAAIFDAALELPTAQRAAYLDHACDGDAALRRRIESLLKACESKCEFLDLPTDPATAQTINDLPPSFEKAGDRIGRYKLLEQIGEGGCGVVYLAEQEEPVSRRVALKVIKLGLDTKSVIARFEAERQALAMMDHPNIAKVLDAGATATGRPFFVMELVRGVKITEYCDNARLSTNARLDLFIQVCQAIQHAHQKGIIHRDIKPSNILVTVNDGVPVPKVIDFGIAKATGGLKLTTKTLFTAFEQFIGTPAYMSPEQAVLTSLDIDTRSDIYTLGVLLYELLTGKTPFDATDLLAIGLDEMCRAIREQEPPRPSTRIGALAPNELSTTAQRRGIEAPKLASELRGDLDWIVMKALEKDRARRYETATGLANDVQRHLDNEVVSATPPSLGYRLRKFARRNRTALSVAVGIAALLVAATVVSSWLAVRAMRAEELARVQAERATVAEAMAKQRLTESEAIAEFLTTAFQSPDPARDSRTITVAEMLDTAAKKLDTDLADQPGRRAALQAALGKTYQALGLYREAIPLLDKVLEYHRAAAGPEHPDTLGALNNLANSYYSAGRWDEALKLREEMLPLFRKVLGPEHPDTLKGMSNLAVSYSAAGRRDEALKLREEVLALILKVRGPEHPDTLMAMTNLSNSYFAAGRRDEALKLREKVLTLRRELLRPAHPATLMAMINVANSYYDASRRDEALKMQEEVLELSRRVNGPEHPATLLPMNTLACWYSIAGRRDEGLKLLGEALPLFRKVLGPAHPDTLLATTNLANSYYEANRLGEALKLREEVLELSLKMPGPKHPDTLKAMNNLALSYYDAGRRDEALKMREKVLVLRREVLRPDHPDTLKGMAKLAISYADAGRRDEALKLREEVLPLFLKVLGPDHPDTLNAMTDLASSYAVDAEFLRRAGHGPKDELQVRLHQQLTQLAEQLSKGIVAGETAPPAERREDNAGLLQQQRRDKLLQQWQDEARVKVDAWEKEHKRAGEGSGGAADEKELPKSQGEEK
jgi:serine/threonine protein kinase/tetratricopeptide (TPR) repeat protein